MDKKKKRTAAAAVAAAAVLLLGGTFAWQSISQMALNEASDVINPGGRLHDDFYIDSNGDYNSDIYVENFADDDIFARVQLSEYMEIVVNKGVAGAEKVETVVGSKSSNGTPVTDKTTDNTSGYQYEYVTHYFDQPNATDEIWAWTAGDADSEQVYYMPTFNKNKDSLVADRNGMYVDRIGGISNHSKDQYEEWTEWKAGDAKDGTAIYDADSNQADEVGFDFERLTDYETAGNVKTAAETHTADVVGKSNGLISMSDWMDKLNNGDDTADYWVYDMDGWVYWSSPIKAGETTGLLLDAIDLKKVMDDTWYYAIEAKGQFVTKDDLGSVEDNTGFFANNESVSDDALQLLEKIGVDIDDQENSLIVGPDTVAIATETMYYVDDDSNAEEWEWSTADDYEYSYCDGGALYVWVEVPADTKIKIIAYNPNTGVKYTKTVTVVVPEIARVDWRITLEGQEDDPNVVESSDDGENVSISYPKTSSGKMQIDAFGYDVNDVCIADENSRFEWNVTTPVITSQSTKLKLVPAILDYGEGYYADEGWFIDNEESNASTGDLEWDNVAWIRPNGDIEVNKVRYPEDLTIAYTITMTDRATGDSWTRNVTFALVSGE